MKLRLDNNGWTVHVTELDPRSVTQQELDMLRIVPYTNLLLVIHDLPVLTSEEYRTFCLRFFDKIQNDFPTKDTRFLPGHNKEIMRVTGRRSQDGEITGLFGMPTFLPWHSDQPGIPLDRRPDCLVLYSVEGTANSVTGFSNSILALRDLRLADDAPQGLLENLDRLEVLYDYTADLDQASTNIADHNYRGPPGKNKLVIKNKAGACGILFNNQSTDSFYIGDDKLPYETYKVWRDYLSKFLIQQKYIYAHNWEDHEIIMNCQTLSQHCRLPFIKIQERLLWRIAGYTLPFDTSDIDFGNLKTYICDH